MPQLYTECAGLHCSRYSGQLASVNNWRPYRAYPGTNFTARVPVAQRVPGRPGGCCDPFRGGAGSPSNTMSPGLRPTSLPSGILILLSVKIQPRLIF